MKKLNIYRFVKAPKFEILKDDEKPRNTPLWVRYRDVEGIIKNASSDETVALEDQLSTCKEVASRFDEAWNGLTARCKKAEKKLQATEIELADAKKINAETAENPGILLERATKAEDELLTARGVIATLENAVADSKKAAPKQTKKSKTKSK